MLLMDSVTDTLKSAFGFDRFRDGQERVVEKLLAGESVLAIFPTGGGKSLCYQLPALMLDGITLVISPLIALMKDQIEFLRGRGISAARLDSTVETEEARQVYADMRSGKLKLLYIAPERLASERFLQTLGRLNISMLAVDEAHCISEWGHNFRPDYMKIATLARELGVNRVLALTATATPDVARDIARQFGIADDAVVQTGFYRPNLSLHITPMPGKDRPGLLLQKIRSRPRGPTIVYVTLQKTAEGIARHLEDAGLPAKAYHAGLESEVRHEVQDWFMASDDAIVVATIAFGMGIDKSNIRYVYHYNLPKSVENYAQEIGRAGRDGKPATCEMLAAVDDLTILENFTFGDTPTPQSITQALERVLKKGAEPTFDVSTYELSGEFDMRPLVIDTLLTYLELDGIIESTGPFYTEYKFQPTKPSAQILARFDASRSAFLKKILAQAKKAKTWHHIDLVQTAAAIGEPRERLVSALNFLEQQGDLIVQMAGARHGYRHKRRDWEMKTLSARMNERFQHREKRDIERLGSVVQLINHPGCKTRFLLKYFGENRPANCGHCAPCEGIKHKPLPAAAAPRPTEQDAALVRSVRGEKHKALATPRQLARFLCGISSPAVIRGKLTRHAQFGAWSDIPFRTVLEFCESSS